MPLVPGKNVLIESDLSYCHNNRLLEMIQFLPMIYSGNGRRRPFFPVNADGSEWPQDIRQRSSGLPISEFEQHWLWERGIADTANTVVTTSRGDVVPME